MQQTIVEPLDATRWTLDCELLNTSESCVNTAYNFSYRMLLSFICIYTYEGALID